MRTVLLASLRTHTRRHVAAALAVVIGVTFVVATGGLTAAARDGLTGGLADPYDAADAVVTDVSGADAVALKREHVDDASVLGWVVEPVRHDGVTVDRTADVAEMPTDPDLRWPTLEDGAFPTGPGEAALDRRDATKLEVGLGDRIEVGSGAGTTTVTVTALVDSPSALVTATVYLVWDDLAPFADDLFVQSIAWRGDTAVVTDVAPSARVQDVDTFLAETLEEVNQQVDAIALLLLLFGAVALFVSVLVIANTFTILLAQRQRDLALLRCVGATRRQLRRSITVEAAVLGLVSSIAALLLGTLAARGLTAGIAAAVPDAGIGSPSVPLTWYVGALVLGVGVTLVAATLPLRRAARVSPLAALHPDAGPDVRSRAGVLRVVAGSLMAVVGAVLLAFAVARQDPLVMVAGGSAAFTGVLLLGPVLVPGVIRLLPVRLLGPAAALAAGNAVRHPRRTAATAASLVVGVTLTTAVLTGLASSRGAVDEEMARQHPVDATVTGTDAPLAAGLAEAVAAADGVERTRTVPGTRAEVQGLGAATVLAAGDDGVPHHPLDPRPGELWLPYDAGGNDLAGRTVSVTTVAGTQRLRVVGGEGWGDTALVAPRTLTALDPDAATWAVWVRAGDVDADDLGGDLEALAHPSGATTTNDLANRQYVDLQLDVVTGAVVGMLAIAIVIALLGIGNTLGLSVLERGREHALLRALGFRRRQLRATLATEAMLLSVVATAIGVALGLVFAWVGLETMVRTAVDDVPLLLPWGQLAAMVAVTTVAGLAACVLPARRAARTAPAAVLAAE